MKVHDAANLFPLMKGQEYRELVESIRALGLLKPIELYRGEILDGRNRWHACREAGVEPRFVCLPEDIDPYAYVWAVNAERRHLAPGQKAAILVLQKQKSAAWQADQEAKRREANRRRSEAAEAGLVGRAAAKKKTKGEFSHVSRDTTLNSAWTRHEVAQEAQVSTATAARAQALGNKRPDLLEKVAAGETTLTNALRIAKKDSLAQELPPPAGKYRVIYADPPWKYSDKLTEGYGPADNHFPPMSIPELCALTIPAQDNAVLFLWVTSPMLEDAANYARTGNLYIETAEKAYPRDGDYYPSGIYAHEATWLYIIGDYDTVFLFPKKLLVMLDKAERYRRVIKETSLGFLIPDTDAKKYAEVWFPNSKQKVRELVDDLAEKGRELHNLAQQNPSQLTLF